MGEASSASREACAAACGLSRSEGSVCKDRQSVAMLCAPPPQSGPLSPFFFGMMKSPNPSARKFFLLFLSKKAPKNTARQNGRESVFFASLRLARPHFSQCLTFWYFWVKPKVQRKTIVDFQPTQGLGGSFRSQPSTRRFFRSFFRRKSQRRPRGENDRESAAHLAERSQKTALFCTIVPGARCAAASSSDIFTSRKQAGLWPAKRI